jgi:hypothetical protein
MTKAEFKNMVNLLKMIVYCHRYQSNEDYLKELPLDFTVVRDPMYAYSREAQNRFMAESGLAFFFSYFAE